MDPTRHLEPFTGLDLGNPVLAARPDGGAVAVGQAQVGICDVWILALPAFTPLARIRPRASDPYLDRLAWSSDGALLAIGTRGAVYVWDPARGEEVCALEGLRAPISWRPGGRALYAFDADGALTRVDVGSGARERLGPLAAPVHHGVEFSWRPDGRRVALWRRGYRAPGYGGTAELWDLDPPARVEVLEGESYIHWDARGRRWSCAPDQGLLRVRIPDGPLAELREAPLPEGPQDFAWAGAELLGWMRLLDETATRIDPTTGASLGAVFIDDTDEHDASEEEAASIAEVQVVGRRALVLRGGPSRLECWDLDDAVCLSAVGPSVTLEAARLTPSGALLVTSVFADPPRVEVLDATTLRPRGRWTGWPPWATPPGHARFAFQGPDGDILVTRLGHDAAPLALVGHVGDVFDLDWSADGRHLVSTGIDGTLRVWDVDTRREVLRDQSTDWLGSWAGVPGGCWSPDGRTLAWHTTDDTPQDARLWDRDRDRVRPLHDAEQVLAWIDDDRLLALGEGLAIWDRLSGAPVLWCPLPSAGPLAVRPDMLALRHDDALSLWRYEHAEPLVTLLQGLAAHQGLGWTSRGALLVHTFGDRLRLVAPDGRILLDLEGARAVDEDTTTGTLVVSDGIDLRLFDAQGAPVGHLRGSTGHRVRHVQVAEGGGWICTHGTRSAAVWHVARGLQRVEHPGQEGVLAQEGDRVLRWDGAEPLYEVTWRGGFGRYASSGRKLNG
ncbi:MAG: WD40 repeat domain-containing protein [Alphaproteobacteria bacterium]|nr:WD40 repeat domain-containing protein [Alphaproteobacteria bacterium]